MKLRFLSLVLVLSGLAATAQVPTDSMTTLQRTILHMQDNHWLWQLAWQNPAAMQWKQHYSLSSVTLAAEHQRQDQAVVSQLGDGRQQWSFKADTHMKHHASTLWGRATYTNGSTRHITWNETSDWHMVYPYVMADSAISTPMKHELYAFMGGYASHNKRLHWGIEAGYQAGLYYRNVDPRPKNVTARLHLKGGLGLTVYETYAAAASLEYMKYKQTNDVAFYSELGKEKLFHLTGLANDYSRFAGAADNTYFSGHQWSASLNLLPQNCRGLFFSVMGQTMSMDKVLTTLNKLPMAHIRHRAMRSEAGWQGSHWSVRAHMDVSRRVGTENIFGDPAASIYLRIASLDIYHENRLSAGADACVSFNRSNLDMDIRPSVVYQHKNTIYADPQCQQLTNQVNWSLAWRGGVRTPRSYTSLTLGAQGYTPTKTMLAVQNVKPELEGLRRILERDFQFAAHHALAFATQACTNVALSRQFVVRAALAWRHTRYCSGVKANDLNATLSLLF